MHYVMRAYVSTVGLGISGIPPWHKSVFDKNVEETSRKLLRLRGR
jgi:hypothetical protein